MAIANFPANLQNAIQLGFLQKRFTDGVKASLGYRQLATKEPFYNNIGETLTKTRNGLLPAVTTPLAPNALTNLDDGLTPTAWNVEQYTVSINEYASTMDLNVVANRVGIADQFIKNAEILGEQAKRSLDLQVRQVLLNAYMGGNTRVAATLGSAGPVIAVDDIRGFQFAIPTTGANSGKPNIPVSTSNTMPVQVGSNIYTLQLATADTVNVSTVAAIGGISGTLTFSANVTVPDGTLNNSVIGSFAPTIFRPSGKTNTSQLVSGDVLTLDLCRQAVTRLRENAMPEFSGMGYTLVLSDRSFQQLYRDPEFQILFRGTEFGSNEYRNFAPSSMTLGFNIIRLNVAPITQLGTLFIQRPLMVADGAIEESSFVGADAVLSGQYGSDNYRIMQEDDIYMVNRAQLDRIKHIIAQSWFFIGGWVAPTDQTVNSTTVPTANAAYYKRAVLLETA